MTTQVLSHDSEAEVQPTAPCIEMGLARLLIKASAEGLPSPRAVEIGSPTDYGSPDKLTVYTRTWAEYSRWADAFQAPQLHRRSQLTTGNTEYHSAWTSWEGWYLRIEFSADVPAPGPSPSGSDLLAGLAEIAGAVA